MIDIRLIKGEALENRCKNDMNSKEWNDLKQNINSYFI
jgi:hypothetical protein